MAPRCQHCQAKMRSPKRSGRKAAFCSYQCRDAARRTRNFEGSGNTRKRTQAIPRNAPKSSTISSPCKGDFADRGPVRSAPINLLGGGSFRWPGALPLDPETREKIYWCEIGEPPAAERVVKKRKTGDGRSSAKRTEHASDSSRSDSLGIPKSPVNEYRSRFVRSAAPEPPARAAPHLQAEKGSTNANEGGGERGGSTSDPT